MSLLWPLYVLTLYAYVFTKEPKKLMDQQHARLDFEQWTDISIFALEKWVDLVNCNNKQYGKRLIELQMKNIYDFHSH